MLYYIAFYEITHRPYIREFYIIAILFLSFSPPSIHIFFLYFASQVSIQLVFLLFMQNGFQLLQWYDQDIISWLVFCIQIIRSDELVISSIVISSYYGKSFFNPKPNKKTNESHTKHSNFIKRSIEILFNPIELRTSFFVLIEEKKNERDKKRFLIFFLVFSVH